MSALGLKAPLLYNKLMHLSILCGKDQVCLK